MKIKKNKKIKLINITFAGILLIIFPFFLSSCSTTNSIETKVLNKSEDINQTYSNASLTNISFDQAIYGSNFNDGNYIFIYGTTGSKDFRNFIYGPQPSTLGKEETFKSSTFLTEFFGKGNLGNGFLPYNVQILLYLDIEPLNDNFSTVIPEDKSGITPYNIWTSEQVINEYNTIAGTDFYDVTNLPDQAKYKIGTYKRYDESAIRYRENIDYMLKIRPSITGVSGNNKNGGLIAFKKNQNPKTFEANFSSISSLNEYYEKK